MPFDCNPAAWVQANGDPLAASSKKIYRSALNRLAKEGWASKEDLLKEQDAVVAHIKNMDAPNRYKRMVLSAIFKVLADVPHPQQAGFYKLFQSVKVE